MYEMKVADVTKNFNLFHAPTSSAILNSFQKKNVSI
jgi:hypothetical protein